MPGWFARPAVCAYVLALTLCCTVSAHAQTGEEMEYLRIFYADKDLVVTPSRSAKPISQVAENVTVVTAEEIEAINAHTLADVLYHVTGVQVDRRGGPGAVSSVLIQGSEPRHVQLMVDGVSLNNISDNVPDIGAFPVQQIERIEVVKGPASSSWGSSLGGVINIITRSADSGKRLGGSFYASGGERGTGDFRTDLTGTVGPVGYYLYGGGLTSDGLTPGTNFDAGNVYAKLQWEAARRTNLQCTLAYDKGARGEGQVAIFDLARNSRFERFFSTFGISHVLDEATAVDLSGRVSKKRSTFFVTRLSNSNEIERDSFDDLNLGGSAKFTWKSSLHNLLAGIDYDNGRLEANVVEGGRQRLEKWAVFANDTLSFGDFSVTPGVRYDYTSTNGDFVSPSLGLTYTPVEQTIFRGYVARGFNIPPLSFTFGGVAPFRPNPDLKVEEVWSYSLGMETVLFDHLWARTTGFLHEISDVIEHQQLSPQTVVPLNSGKQRRQGVEVELKTTPVFSTSLQAGFAFVDATDRRTGQEIVGIPRYTWDLGVDYNDNESLRGTLRGHYVWWNASSQANARYKALIWDLNLAKKVVERENGAIELFFTAHNIFNGSQYSSGFFPNPRRWFEGGVSFKF